MGLRSSVEKEAQSVLNFLGPGELGFRVRGFLSLCGSGVFRGCGPTVGVYAPYLDLV